jgi:sulfur-carrier protein
MARVTLLYFASIREAVGHSDEICDLPDTIQTPHDLISWLSERSAGYAAAFANPDRLRCAIDQSIVPLGSAIGSAQEIAFFPPVTGG